MRFGVRSPDVAELLIEHFCALFEPNNASGKLIDAFECVVDQSLVLREEVVSVTVCHRFHPTSGSHGSSGPCLYPHTVHRPRLRLCIFDQRIPAATAEARSPTNSASMASNLSTDHQLHGHGWYLPSKPRKTPVSAL